MINNVNRDDIIGKKILQCYETEETVYDDGDATTSLIFKLNNEVMLDLLESFNVENKSINNDSIVIENLVKKATPCFKHIWKEEIVAITSSSYCLSPLILLSNNFLLFCSNYYPITHLVFGPRCEIYENDTHGELFDFWTRERVKVNM